MAKKRAAFVPAQGPPNGSRTRAVTAILERIVEAAGNPVPYEDTCVELGIKYPADILPAMTALEITGTVKRYTYAETGSTRKRNAYSLVTEDDAVDPT